MPVNPNNGSLCFLHLLRSYLFCHRLKASGLRKVAQDSRSLHRIVSFRDNTAISIPIREFVGMVRECYAIKFHMLDSAGTSNQAGSPIRIRTSKGTGCLHNNELAVVPYIRGGSPLSWPERSMAGVAGTWLW